jgi:hypothetical protein
LLWQVAGDAIPDFVKQFGEEVRTKLFKRGLTEGLGFLLREQTIVERSDAKFVGRTTEQIHEGLLAAQRVADNHKHWRWWFPKVTLGGRVLALLPLPGKRPWVALATFVMVGLSVWLAAAFAGSPELPGKLKFGIDGVPDVVLRQHPTPRQ